MSIIRCFVKLIVYIVEKVIWELAILAAILSTTEPGTYLNRIVGGMTDILRAIYGFTYAYVMNVGFRDFMGSFSTAILKELGRFASNVETNPRKVLFAFIATFITYKVISWLLGLFRRRFLCRRKKEGPPSKRRDKGDNKGSTYEQLYEQPEPPAHDAQ